MQINSREYWQQRFQSDWDQLGGPAQTAFFTRLALDAMPDWFVSQVRGSGLTVCDWGCAEGEGTALLSEALRTKVVGIDFSEEAIDKARARFPGNDFRAVDLLSEPSDWRFDILFSSNTLEHFHDPWATFDRLQTHAQRHVVLMLPFREIERHPEHFHGFDPQGLPLARGDWMLTHAAIINAANVPGSLWPGEQLLAIYTRQAEAGRLGLSLSMVRIDTPQLERYRHKADDNRQAAQEVRSLLAGEMGTRIADMQHALVGAISEDIQRMQTQHAALLREAAGMQAELAKRQVHADWQAARLVEQEAAATAAQANMQARIQALQSHLDTLQGEVASMQLASAEVARSRDSLQEIHDMVLRSWSWRLTRPFRVTARLLRSGGMDRSDREKIALLSRRFRRGAGNVHADVRPLPRPAGSSRSAAGLMSLATLRSAGISPAAAGDKADVYVWSVIDWHFRTQRPQHLAMALRDAGHRVFYISNNFVNDAIPGFSVEPLDEHGTLYQVHLNLAGAPMIYHALPAAEHCSQLDAGLRLLLEWNGCRESVSIVQHPYWSFLAERLPRMKLVYDCMDHHAGFQENAPQMAAEENRLMTRSDLVVVTSAWLERQAQGNARRIALVRNAGDYDMFSRRPREIFADPQGRRVIGYYGAIADWFDDDLVREVALAYPEALVLLVGSDTAGVGGRLADVPNVRMVGEVKYDELPYWLHGFDVCLLPFRVRPLTLATNPVKVYEYLAAGKAVVAVDLPEMAQFDGHVACAGDSGEFVRAVGEALQGATHGSTEHSKQEFAAGQTWRHRADELDAALAAIPVPTVSIVVVTYNNLEYTRACLASLERDNDWPRTEVVVVDNASSDGTRQFLEEWQLADPTRKVILNGENRGFAAANNQGIDVSAGEYLILLNNDTFVTRGWLRGLVDALRRDDSIGLAGPVTNNIGNEAKIEIQYGDMNEMSAAAAQFTGRHRGQTFRMATLAFFCVAMRRSTFDAVGPLDEQFGMGFFEDDDYCRRVEAQGLHNVCVEDVFVHHHLSATFNRIDQAKRRELFERNKVLYERKWGAWTPHGERPAARGEPTPRS